MERSSSVVQLGSAAARFLPHLGGFRVSSESRCAGGDVGGDFCSLTVRAPGRVLAVIGDACGRGRDGAVLLRTLLPRMRDLSRSAMSPAELLTELNREAAAELPLDRFVTAAAFELDRVRGRLVAANAGHVPAIVRQADGGTRVVGHPSGPPLGFSSNAVYRDERCVLAQGDAIVLMTDGVLEAVEGDLLAMRTLQRLMREASDDRGGVHRLLLAKLDECVAGRSGDDMTLVTLEVDATDAADEPSFRRRRRVSSRCAY